MSDVSIVRTSLRFTNCVHALCMCVELYIWHVLPAQEVVMHMCACH